MNPDAQRLAAWREQLTQGRKALCDAYLAQPRPAALLGGLSKLTDQVLGAIWAASGLPADAALVAVGGYGRGDLYPQSDVDVLILIDDCLDSSEHTRFEPLIALFWDVGLPIGHSVRCLSECLAESAGDVTIQTNLLDARWLAGNRDLCRRMIRALGERMHPAAFYKAKLLEQKTRHGRNADLAMRLEPNLKESPGGLRDVQTLLWVSKAAGLADDIAGLARAGLLTHEEARSARTNLKLIADLRIRVHLAANRREDRLLFEHQERIAVAMGITASGTRRASERLMQRYFRAARRLLLINELVLEELQTRLLTSPLPLPLDGTRDFQRAGNLLDADEALIERQPGLILESFLVLARHPELTGFTPRLLRALWRAGRRIDTAFRTDTDNHLRFLALMREPRGITQSLRLMHQLGILGRYLPAFGRITGQMQHDQFHIYPVDEHILTVLRNLRRMALAEFDHELPLAHRLMADFQRPDLLYLAALFHDIAKGRGGDHSSLGAADARRFCRGQDLPDDDTKLVAWLVAEHLNLSMTAQKQDLSDPAVIAAFAARCPSTCHLTALYLLTVADIRGTSPKVWNAWKDKLTRELYLAARRVLEGGRPRGDSVEEKKELARIQLRLYGLADGAEEALWQRLSEAWFLRQDATDIAWQSRRLLQLLARGETHAVRARLAPVGEGVEVLVYVPDQEGLFARICAFFARLGYSILMARIHTTQDGYALDTFYAHDPEARQVAYRDILSYIEHELGLELIQPENHWDIPRGRLARQLKAFPIEPEVSLNVGDDRRNHVLTFTAGDRTGLLAQVAQVLCRHDVSVTSARINTLGNRAEDVFVLAGEKLERPGERIRLESELVDVLRVS